MERARAFAAAPVVIVSMAAGFELATVVAIAAVSFLATMTVHDFDLRKSLESAV